MFTVNRWFSEIKTQSSKTNFGRDASTQWKTAVLTVVTENPGEDSPVQPKSNPHPNYILLLLTRGVKSFIPCVILFHVARNVAVCRSIKIKRIGKSGEIEY